MKHSKPFDDTKESDDQILLDIYSKAEAIQNQADAEGRDLTDNETNQIIDIEAEFQAAKAELDNTYQGAGRKSLPSPIGQGPGRNINHPVMRNPKDKSWKGLFGNAARDDRGWKSNEQFLQTIAHNQSHSNLRNASMTEGTGADGGFIVPDQLVTDLMDGSLESEIIRPRAKVYPMQSNIMGIAGVNTQDHTSTIGGLTGTWMGEGESATPQKAVFRKAILKANKLAIFTTASNELVEDGLSFEQQLSDAMRNAISLDLDYAFINGNGAGLPQGILNADSKITVAKESGQTADTIVFENIVNMWSRLHPGLVNDAIWIANSNVIPQLFQMSFEGSSSSVPAFMPAGSGISGAPTNTLMGRPIVFTEKCPTLGDQGDIILVAPSQYAIGLRREASLQRSIHEGWLTDETDWRLIIRVTGMPLWSDVVTPRTGSTLSWCVTLADRA